MKPPGRRQDRALRLALAGAGLPSPDEGGKPPRGARKRLAGLLRAAADRLDPAGARTSPFETRAALAELFTAVGAVAGRYEFTPPRGAPPERRPKP